VVVFLYMLCEKMLQVFLMMTVDRLGL
jgi:hypothetical protein